MKASTCYVQLERQSSLTRSTRAKQDALSMHVVPRREQGRHKSEQLFATSLPLTVTVKLSDSICLKNGRSVLHTGANAASAAASGRLSRQNRAFLRWSEGLGSFMSDFPR
jgi:hypothetical protein